MFPQNSGDVGERTYGDEGDGFGGPTQRVSDELRRPALVGLEGGLGDLGSLEPTLAVDVLGGVELTLEGGGGAGGHRHVGMTDQGEDSEGVARGLLQGYRSEERRVGR